MTRILWLVIALAVCCQTAHANEPDASPAVDEALDLFCLRIALPQDFRTATGEPEASYLYRGSDRERILARDNLRASLAQDYPLEPHRPPTPAGIAPGRARPYQLYDSLYGKTAREVKKGLIAKKFNGRNMQLHSQAAAAFGRALPRLQKLAAAPETSRYLVPEGGFYWRNIAGENRLSAHSYGIALDVGVKSSPYWRWSKEMPHPLQQTYPGAIVEEMERHGFIWGGKWHEYDLMHYEYRPELICKARMTKAFMTDKFPQVPLLRQ